MGNPENKSSGPEILIWVSILVLIGLLALIAVPNFLQVRDPRQRNNCINNLRQIGAAKQEWALENGKTNGDIIVTENDIRPYFGRGSEGSIPQCPSGGKYTIGKLGEPPTCSLGTNVNPPHVLP